VVSSFDHCDIASWSQLRCRAFHFWRESFHFLGTVSVIPLHPFLTFLTGSHLHQKIEACERFWWKTKQPMCCAAEPDVVICWSLFHEKAFVEQMNKDKFFRFCKAAKADSRFHVPRKTQKIIQASFRFHALLLFFAAV
jgi:hypothetical protein